jgi:hypothetical protein
MNGISMAMNYQQIIESLDGLKAEDFDLNRVKVDGQERLCSLTEELLQQPNPERFLPVLFGVMERMPGADLGSPGPLVHTLEQIKGYESELVASARRAPCPLSVWMVNRILNAAKNPEQRDAWLNLLDSVATSSTATSQTKQAALQFIQFQRKKSK